MYASGCDRRSRTARLGCVSTFWKLWTKGFGLTPNPRDDPDIESVSKTDGTKNATMQRIVLIVATLSVMTVCNMQ